MTSCPSGLTPVRLIELQSYAGAPNRSADTDSVVLDAPEFNYEELDRLLATYRIDPQLLHMSNMSGELVYKTGGADYDRSLHEKLAGKRSFPKCTEVLHGTYGEIKCEALMKAIEKKAEPTFFQEWGLYGLLGAGGLLGTWTIFGPMMRRVGEQSPFIVTAALSVATRFVGGYVATGAAYVAGLVTGSSVAFGAAALAGGLALGAGLHYSGIGRWIGVTQAGEALGDWLFSRGKPLDQYPTS